MLKTLWRWFGGETPHLDLTPYGFPLRNNQWLDTKGRWRDFDTDPPTAYEPRFASIYRALDALEKHR